MVNRFVTFTPNQFKSGLPDPRPEKVEKKKGRNGLPIKKATGEKEVFDIIWQNRPHVSYVNGEPLGNDAYPFMFSHVLKKNKNAYPKFMLNPKNIVLMTQEQHTAWEHYKSTIQDDPMWAHVFKLEAELKQEYHKLFKDKK